MSAPTTRTIMCDLIDNVLIPSPTGQVPAQVNELLNPDHTKTGSIVFGGQVQGFLTYGFCNQRPVSYRVTGMDPLGHISRSIENIVNFL